MQPIQGMGGEDLPGPNEVVYPLKARERAEQAFKKIVSGTSAMAEIMIQMFT